MFAEDVGLLPERSFTDLLNSLPADGSGFPELVEQLFREMNSGTGKGISLVLRKKLLQFNGGLFADFTVLPVNGLQLGLLKEAAKQNWSHVEPAIFGTLLERALNPGERHKLGAHYTPRAYVERLVLPTVVEPLRAEWESVRAAAFTHARAGNLKAARDEVNAFHDKLCQVRVLDPACGSGNFLYVALEHLKRLEGEILDVGAQFGESFKLELETHSVDPHQFLGLEINPRAAAITELVLWIGYLQWHFRTRGQTMPAEPVLKKFKNIECRDAVLAYDGEPEPARDEAGNVITVWDRKSTKKDPVTGRDVPDETKRVPLLTYKNPRQAEWPAADYIVGNPPFIGARTMRPALEDGYIEAMRSVYPEIAENADLVMYWWHKAADLVRAGKTRRFGFITTNSLRQSFNRSVVQSHMEAAPPISLILAIPDHPWVDTADGAAVRIAMSVGVAGTHQGELLESIDEQLQEDGSAKVYFQSNHGRIQPDLRIGADLSSAKTLKANDPFCCVGYQLTGTGFVLSAEETDALAKKDGIPNGHIFFPLLSARDIVQETRSLWAIDLFGHGVEEVRELYPAVYQRVVTCVKAERDSNKDSASNKSWWLFARPRAEFRPALAGLKRLIVAPLTSKHRIFVFAAPGTVADSTTVIFAFDDAFFLGVLSSRVHVTYSLAAGGRLGVGNDPRYNKSGCFDPFPFPKCDAAAHARIRKVAEELDAHRKRAQIAGQTLTGMYNVLEKLRTNEALNAKEKQIHDASLVSVLRQLHDDLDAAVFAAYGWPPTLTDAEILEHLVALNAERAKEEASGLVRWLRPDYQNPGGAQTQQTTLAVEVEPKAKPGKQRAGKLAWPKTLSERVKAVSTELATVKEPVTAADMAKRFSRARSAEVGEILETLCAMGKARRGKADGTYLS
jgi:hypothetical protein